MNFSPIFKEITVTLRNEKFSVAYFGEHLGKRVVISKHRSLCVLIVLREDSLVPDFIKSISVKDDSVIDGVNILGKKDVILILDRNGKVWQLVNAFEQTESLFMLDEKCFYQWSPFKGFKLDKVYALSVCCSGFVSIGALKSGNKKILLLTSSGLEDCTFEDIYSTQSNSYYLSSFSFNIQETAFEHELQFGNEVFVISDRHTGRTYFSTRNKRNIIINISSHFLISLINFEQAKCFLLCFKNGKLLFQLYNSNSSSPCAEYLSKNLAFIDKCSCCSSGLIWSDGIDSYHTNIQFQVEKVHFTKLTHTKLIPCIRGIISCIKIDKGFIAITINNMFYYFTLKISPESQTSNFLADISQAGSQIEKLNNDIKNCVEFLENQEMIQNQNLVEGFEVMRDRKHIILKSNICKIFNKNYWKVRQRVKGNNKYFVKMADLEIDLSYGMELKIKRISSVNDGWLDLSLFGNFGCDKEFLLLSLEKIREEGKDKDKEDLSKSLCEIAQKRKNSCVQNLKN